MNKIFLSMVLIAFMAAPSFANNGGGKKKAKKKAKTECKVSKCDPKNCDPGCCDYKECLKQTKCTLPATCSGS